MNKCRPHVVMCGWSQGRNLFLLLLLLLMNLLLFGSALTRQLKWSLSTGQSNITSEYVWQKKERWSNVDTVHWKGFWKNELTYDDIMTNTILACRNQRRHHRQRSNWSWLLHEKIKPNKLIPLWSTLSDLWTEQVSTYRRQRHRSETVATGSAPSSVVQKKMHAYADPKHERVQKRESKTDIFFFAILFCEAFHYRPVTVCCNGITSFSDIHPHWSGQESKHGCRVSAIKKVSGEISLFVTEKCPLNDAK